MMAAFYSSLRCLGVFGFIFLPVRQNGVPNVKKPSCEKLGPKSMADMQAMRCKICGFNKTIYNPSRNHSDHPPD